VRVSGVGAELLTILTDLIKDSAAEENTKATTPGTAVSIDPG
jgi:hypothetical protein